MRNRVRSVDPDFAMFIRSHRDLVSVDRENWEPGSELYAWREHVAGDSMRHRRDFLVQQVAEDRDDGVLAECRAKIERLKTALEVERAAVRRQNKRIEILSADASPETIAALSALPKK